MKASQLFDLYEEQLLKLSQINSVFSDSGQENTYRILEFGFFPLGSGIFKDEGSKIDLAEISHCNIMVLGNDFGTQEYMKGLCKKHREKRTNPTIRNLLNGLSLDDETTFFTNLFLGLRINGTNTKRAVALKEEYRSFCFDFFKVQLEFFNPKIVLCLGKEVGKVLSEYQGFSAFKKNIFELFKDEVKKEYIVITDDQFFGQRRFILIPHPSFAHINWEKGVKEKIKSALVI